MRPLRLALLVRLATVCWILSGLAIGACGDDAAGASSEASTEASMAGTAGTDVLPPGQGALPAAMAGGPAPQAGSAGMSHAADAGQRSGAGSGAAPSADAAASTPDSASDAGAAAADAQPAAAPCPPGAAYAPGDHVETLEHQSRTRRFTVHVPSSLAVGQPAALVLDFHGNTSSGAQQAAGSGWQQKADREGFVVVFPDGVGNAWNVGNCCGQALSQEIDDVGFARAIVAAVSDAICIDPKRVYATGISNGGGLAHRLACEAADMFAAIAAASADLVTDPCTPARPIAELSVRGESDFLVAYEGGNTGSTGWYSPGAKGTLELWKGINDCQGSPAQVLEYCETYDTCAAGVEVTLCSLPGTGHILYDNALDFDVPDVAWAMFERQPMP